MVTDLRRRPVMGFLYLGVEAGGVYRWAIGQRLGTPICNRVSFRNVLGREYTQPFRSTPYGQ